MKFTQVNRNGGLVNTVLHTKDGDVILHRNDDEKINELFEEAKKHMELERKFLKPFCDVPKSCPKCGGEYINTTYYPETLEAPRLVTGCSMEWIEPAKYQLEHLEVSCGSCGCHFGKFNTKVRERL